MVSSTGSLDVFRFLGPSAGPNKLAVLQAIRIPGLGDDVLFLSFAWHPTIPNVVAVTTSQGEVHILKLGLDNEPLLNPNGPIVTHTLEAWCVAICPGVPTTSLGQVADTSAPFTLFSGADDSSLDYVTCDIGDGGAGTGGASFTIDTPFKPEAVSGHEAGVTAILPLSLRRNEQDPDLVVTGSYDDHIRVYSIMPLHKTGGYKQARLMTDADLGGGVWRLRLIAVDDGDGDAGGAWRAWVLASCMHAGARIIELRGSGGADCSIEVLGRFEEHKSMNYGSDVQPGDTDRNLICVSTSFYDKLLCLWRFRLDRK